MKKRKWGVAVIAIVVVLAWIWLGRNEDRLLWVRSYGANMVRTALSPEGRLVVVAANQVEVIDGNGDVETILTRPTQILEFVDQHDTGFLIADWQVGQSWLRKYTWEGQLLWEQTVTGPIRQIKSSPDGHFAGVINGRELVLFDPNSAVIWKKSEPGRSYECLPSP